MKRTVTISLFGTAYTIDEDANQLLEQYFSNMRSYFGRQAGGDEIADDIEHRVAELLWDIREKGNGWNAISIEQVKEIIEKVGNPEQLARDAADDAPADTPDVVGPAEATDHGPDAPIPTPKPVTGEDGAAAGGGTHADGGDRHDEPRHDDQTGGTDYASATGEWLRNRRFYRDPQDKRVGGVISGACHYFGGNDPLVWRLLVVLLTFLTEGLPVLPYILLWVIAPEAHTAEERLRMKGKKVNAESIRSELFETHDTQQASAQPSQGSQPRGCLSGLTDAMAGIFKALVILIGVGIAIALLFPIIALVLAVCNVPLFAHILGFGFERTMPVLTIFTLVTVVALPIYALGRWLFKGGNRSPLPSWLSVLLVLAWVLALAFSLYSGARYLSHGVARYADRHWNYSISTTSGSNATRTDRVDYFDAIEMEGVGGVVVRTGQDYRVECRGTLAMIEKTEISVEDGVLRIRNTEDNGYEPSGNVSYTITVPTLRSATMQGVACMLFADTIRCHVPFELRLEGVGRLQAEYIIAPKVTATNEGVGSSELTVDCDSLIVNCEGIGSIRLAGQTHYYQRNNDLLGTIKDSGLEIRE